MHPGLPLPMLVPEAHIHWVELDRTALALQAQDDVLRKARNYGKITDGQYNMLWNALRRAVMRYL